MKAQLVVILMVSTIFPTHAHADEDAEPREEETAQSEEPADSNLVDDDALSIRLFYDRINLSLYLKSSDKTRIDPPVEIEYFTQTDWIVGAAFGRGPFSFAVSYALPGTNGATDTKGRTSLAAYRVQYDLPGHSFEVYHYTFRGFAYRNSSEVGSRSEEKPAPFERGILAHSSGVNYTFITDPDDFNLPGTLNGTRAKTSGVSLLASAQVSGFNVDSDKPLVPDALKAKFGSQKDVRKLGSFKMYGGPGFGGSLIINEFDLSAGIFLNLGLRLDHDSTSSAWRSSGMGLSVPSRLGARFTNGSFEAGVYGVFENESRGTNHDLNFSWYQSMIETYVSYRF